jgi:UDP-glucose-4-epimerase GalE
MTKILVTGGAGYIGSHTCKKLFAEGFTPVVFDDLSTGHKDLVRWGELIVGDLADKEAVRNVFKNHDIAAVIHLASRIDVAESVLKPGDYYNKNVNTSLILLEVMREFGVRNIVFSSSSAVYGTLCGTAAAEDNEFLPVSPYGKTKLMVEEILQDLAEAKDVSTICLRYFNVGGADFDGQLGELHEPETHLIPLALSRILGSGTELQLYGHDLPTRDGYCVRDYVHVMDVANSNILALKKLLDSTNNVFETYNIGSGKGYSVLEIIRKIEDITQEKLTYKLRSLRPGDPYEIVANNSKAREFLKWTPLNSNIEIIIGSAYKWHESIRNKKVKN